MNKKMLAKLCAVAVGMIASGGAFASGFQLLEQNGSGLGYAYAGSAVIGEDASTVYYNPAAMTKLEGNNFSAGGALLRPSFRFKNSNSSLSGSNGGDAGGWAVLPNMYGTWQLNDRWFAGIGMGAPFGLSTKFDNDWVGRYQSKEFDIKTYNINPSLAYKATDRLSLGFGLNWQRAEAEYTRMAAAVPGLSNISSTMGISSEAWGWNAGVTFKLSDAMDLGFSYRSRVHQDMKGDVKTTPTYAAADSNVEAKIDLPDTYILSLSQKLSDRWTMLGDISRTNWSTMDQVSIVRTSGAAAGTNADVLHANFRDTWRFALGGIYKMSDKASWKYGLAYDQSPVRGTEERLVSLPDNNRYWVTTGFQWKFDPTLKADLGLAYIYIPKDHIRADQSSSYRGRVEGEFVGQIVILSAQVSKRF